MKRFSFFSALLVLCMGASALHIAHPATLRQPADNLGQVTDGAFRDGLYLGKMAAKRGAPAHVSVGRWSTSQDRAAFAAGYQRGYHELAVTQETSR